MAADIRVFLSRYKMLSATQWTELIAENDFDLMFYPKFNVSEQQGWLPCIYRGRNTGFEYYLEGIEDTVFSIEDNSELAGKDICISFSSPYERKNIACAMVASAILVKYCNGVYWIMNDFVKGEDPIEMARHVEIYGFKPR